MEKKIIVEKRGNGYRAWLAENKGSWEYGTTPSEAVGKLVNTHQEHFGIDIEVQE